MGWICSRDKDKTNIHELNDLTDNQKPLILKK